MLYYYLIDRIYICQLFLLNCMYLAVNMRVGDVAKAYYSVSLNRLSMHKA